MGPCINKLLKLSKVRGTKYLEESGNKVLAARANKEEIFSVYKRIKGFQLEGK